MTRRLTTLWAGTYAIVALIWTLTGRGYPFGANDPDNDLNLLRFVPVGVGAAVFTVLLLGIAVTTLAMGDQLPAPLRTILLVFGWLAAAVLLVVVPDVNVLALLGYAPMLILGAPFGWPDVELSQVINWPIANQIWSVLGGLLLAHALYSWHRPGWLTARSAARWAKPVTYVAAAIPLTYAVTRLAWLAGIPLGVSTEMLRELRENGGVWAGGGLGAFAVVGSILTLGLIQRWGERFPRWVPGLGGRQVPVKLAVIPALVVAGAVLSASLGFLTNARMMRVIGGEASLAIAPMLLWPIWGVALAAAALAYQLRRRGSDDGSDDERQLEGTAAVVTGAADGAASGSGSGAESSAISC